MSKIVCLGISVVDVVTKPVNEIPAKGKLALVDTIELHTGGCAVNTAIDLAKLGQDVGVVGLVGNDSFGEYLIDELRGTGVNTKGIKVTNKASTSASIVLSSSDGERSFLHCLGTNGVFEKDDINFELIENCDVLFVAGSLLMPKFDGVPTAEVLKKAKSMGIFTVLDTAWDSTGRWMKDIKPCLPYLDIFIPSIEEAQMLSGITDEKEIAAKFLGMGVKTVVIKLGKSGCYIKNSSEEYLIPGYEVNAVDTNGAGDSFVAGFISALVDGYNLEACGKFANAVGANCVMEVGASTGIKHKAEIQAFMNRYNHD